MKDPEPAEGEKAFKYYAFISYSHQDNRKTRRDSPGQSHVQWANWLHEELETYKVPPEFIGQTNKYGRKIPGRINPIFRDEAELPTHSNLGDAIRDALEQSLFLIPLCSPRAFRSLYVNEEILYFKKLGRRDYILPLIIDGEPNVADGSKAGFTAAQECFPPALCHAIGADGQVDPTQLDQEPICSDVRTSEDKTEISAYEFPLHHELLEHHKLKLIAGILGVGFDELVQRDQKRQTAEAKAKAQRARRLAIIFAVLTLVALALAAFALWQRNEAILQRKKAIEAKQAADELIRFMQFNLHDQLAKLGHLDLMLDINSRIRVYQDEHPAEPWDTVAKNNENRDRSVTLDQYGDILTSKGLSTAALRAYQQGLAIREQLAQAAPGNTDWQTLLAASYDHVGSAQQSQDQFDEAAKDYQLALGIHESLAKADPGNVDLASTVSNDYGHLGDVLQAQGHLPEAQQAYQSSLAVVQPLARRFGGNDDLQDDLSAAYVRVADLDKATGDLDQALANYQESFTVLNKLAIMDPSNSGRQYEISVNEQKTGHILELQGKDDQALKAYDNSRLIAEKLAGQDASNVYWQKNLASCYSSLGDLLQKQNQFADALSDYRKCIDISTALLKQDVTNVDLFTSLVLNLEQATKMLLALPSGDRAEAAQMASLGLYYLDGIHNMSPGTPPTEQQKELRTSLEKMQDEAQKASPPPRH